MSAHARELRTNQVIFKRFIAAHDPQVLLWDIAPPYDENWRYRPYPT